MRVRSLIEAILQKDPYREAWSSPAWYFQIFRRAVSLRHGSGVSEPNPYPLHVVFSCDLELDPPWNTTAWECRTSYGLEKGLPVLVELLETYGVRGTFFSEGILAERRPDILALLKSKGHEIGCHGYSHESYGSPFRMAQGAPAPRTVKGNEKRRRILLSKEKIEDACNSPLFSFRAPFLHADDETVSMLEEAGLLLDSSLSNTLFGRLSDPYHPVKGVLSVEAGRKGCNQRRELCEVPVTVSLRPRLLPHSPYSWIDAQSVRSVLGNVDHLVALSRLERIPAVLLLVFHPWEFNATANPFGIGTGARKAEGVRQLIERLLSRPAVRFFTLWELYRLWEENYCPVHSAITPE